MFVSLANLAVLVRLFVAPRSFRYHRDMPNLLLRAAVLPIFFVTLSAHASDDADLAAKVEAILPPHVGACVMALKDGSVVFQHPYGVADIESKEPCTPATNFRMASVSK